MLDKLELIEKRFEEITMKLSDPAVLSDPEQFRTLSIEHSSLSPIIEKYTEYKKAAAAHAEAKELLYEGGMDPEFKEMAS